MCHRGAPCFVFFICLFAFFFQCSRCNITTEAFELAIKTHSIIPANDQLHIGDKLIISPSDNSSLSTGVFFSFDKVNELKMHYSLSDWLHVTGNSLSIKMETLE